MENKSIRCFLALTIPVHTQGELGKIQKSLQDHGAKAHWVKANNIHITLRFLGDRPLKKVQRIAEELPSFCPDFHPFKITIDVLGGFPDKDNPKVVWAGLSAGNDQVLDIYQNVNAGLARLGIPKENEKFMSHLTMARCKTPEESRSTAAAIKKTGFAPVETEITSIVFYKSTLSSNGATYEVLQSLP